MEVRNRTLQQMIVSQNFKATIMNLTGKTLFSFRSAILIKTLADASDEKHSLSAREIIMNVVGFAATVATTIFCTILAKKWLKTMPIEDEPLLQ